MAESIIHPEPFPKDFFMFAVIVVWIDLNAFSMLLSLITISGFELQ